MTQREAVVVETVREFIGAQQEPRRTLGAAGAGLLLLVALPILFSGMHVSLFDRDEGWYAQVCREMLESGDWLVPRYLGEVWLAKPPLLYWLVTATFGVFGVGEWQARLVPTLATTVNVLLVGALGARLLGRRTGLLAGVLFITAGLPAIVGKMLLTDALMLMCTLTAVLLHWRLAGCGQSLPSDSESPVRPRPPHALAAGYWLAIGLGILAKGPAVLVFAGAFALALLATPGRRAWIRDRRWWAWMPLALTVAAPWYLYIATHAGETLKSQFLGYEIVSRIQGTPHGHGGPPGYYLLLSLAGWLPWTVFVPGTLVLAVRRCRREATVRLLLVWMALPWIILELIHSKLPHYIMPCYVPLAILLAHLLEEGLWKPKPWSELPAGERRVLASWPMIMVAVGAGLAIAALVKWDARWSWAGLGTAGVLAAGFVLAGRVLRQRSVLAAGAVAVLTTVAFHVAVGWWLLPSLEPFRLSRYLADRLDAEARAGEEIRVCGYEEPSVFFYLSRPGREIKREGVEALLADPRPTLLAVTERALGRMTPAVAATLQAKAPGEPVRGFNYVKMSAEAVWLIHLGTPSAR